MHVIDLALVGSAIVTAPWPRMPWRRRTWATIAVIAAPSSLAMAQLAVHGPRWQLLPVQLAVAVTVIASARELRYPASPGGPRIVVFGVAAFSALSGLLAWALPVVELPSPTGPHAVGTRTMVVTDDTRAERYGPRPGQPRHVITQVWYPALPGPEDSTGAWLSHPDPVIEGIAREYRIPRATLGHLTRISSHAYPDAPVAAGGPYPVVVFSHGWSSMRSLHAAQLASLASHGYVVIGVDHPYAALASVFPDGRAVPMDPTALALGADEVARDAAAAELVATFAADVEHVVARLPAELDDDLATHIDFDRIALAGHSTGGGGAVLACSRNRWCDAVVGLDPWVEPVPDEVIGAGLERPVLSISSAQWQGSANDARVRRLHAGSTGPEGRAAIAGTQHTDFTLLGLFTPLHSLLGLSGPTPVGDTLAISDQLTVEFLDHHLRGRGGDPLGVRHDDPRVTVTTNGNG